jgi:hypothetical protein
LLTNELLLRNLEMQDALRRDERAYMIRWKGNWRL